MRVLVLALLFAGLVLPAIGCGPSKEFDGPTVASFTGKVVSNGKQISIPPGESLKLQLRHETSRYFGIDIKPDGTFEIGWMPIGRYTVLAERSKPGQKGPPAKSSVPGSFLVSEGKTEYVIDMGKAWK
jgi:hypothetical protein